MKVLHITNRDSEGAGLAVLRIHDALVSSGVKSRIIVANKTSAREDVQAAENNHINTTRLSGNKIVSIIQRAFRRAGLLSTTKEKYDRIVCRINRSIGITYSSPLSTYDITTHPWVQEADIIHLHWVSDFLDYPSFFKAINKPVVWTYHDENIGLGGFHYLRDKRVHFKEFQEVEEFYSRIKQKAILGKDIHLVALSEEMKQFAQNNDILNSFKITVIHNSVNLDVFKSDDNRSLKRLLGIPQENKVLAFCSVLIRDSRKGLKELVQAIKGLPKCDHISLICIGNPQGFKPDPDIHTVLTGSIQNEQLLAAILSIADIFVIPSFQEAFAQTPLEAMACGKPVVAFPCSGTRELINEINGVRCRDFTIDALKEGLAEALSKQYDSTSIRQYVSDYFSPEKIASDYSRLYDSIVSR